MAGHGYEPPFQNYPFRFSSCNLFLPKSRHAITARATKSRAGSRLITPGQLQSSRAGEGPFQSIHICMSGSDMLRTLPACWDGRSRYPEILPLQLSGLYNPIESYMSTSPLFTLRSVSHYSNCLLCMACA